MILAFLMTVLTIVAFVVYFLWSLGIHILIFIPVLLVLPLVVTTGVTMGLKTSNAYFEKNKRYEGSLYYKPLPFLANKRVRQWVLFPFYVMFSPSLLIGFLTALVVIPIRYVLRAIGKALRFIFFKSDSN